MAGISDSSLQIDAPAKVVSPPAVKPPPVRRFAAKARVPDVQPPPVAPPPVAEPVAEPSTAPAGSLLPLRVTPSWLVSLAVHLLLLVFLALLTVTTEPKLLATIIDAAFETEAPILEQVTELTLEPLEDVPSVAADAGAGEVLVSEVTEVGGDATTGVAVTEGDLQVDSVSDVGGLFSGDGVGMKDAGSGALKGAEFFGVKAAGKKFVFVVDSSNSMKNGKFDAAKIELEYAIRKLSPEQLFYVVFFDHNAEKMLLPPDTEPPTNVVPATYANVNAFVEWMGTVKNELKTNPYEAVKFALSLQPDAIYILSDGKFTDRGQTVRFLESENVINDPITGDRPRAVIHTIAFWQRDGEEAMQAIAKKHQGTYRFVPQPRK